MSLKEFSIFSYGGHIVLTNQIFLAPLVEGHPRNISLKLFQNLNSSLGGNVVQSNCSLMDIRRTLGDQKSSLKHYMCELKSYLDLDGECCTCMRE